MSSAEYWENRYSGGGNSGDGSYGRLAEFKRGVIKEILSAHQIESVIDLGCGDGNQIKGIPCCNYQGFDVSVTAIRACKRIHPDKDFKLMEAYAGEKADMAMSLDVIFHLTENKAFDWYMQQLFQAANKLVLIYSTNINAPPIPSVAHVKHRRFSAWVKTHATAWSLETYIPNNLPEASNSDFYIYTRTGE